MLLGAEMEAKDNDDSRFMVVTRRQSARLNPSYVATMTVVSLPPPPPPNEPPPSNRGPSDPPQSDPRIQPPSQPSDPPQSDPPIQPPSMRGDPPIQPPSQPEESNPTRANPVSATRPMQPQSMPEMSNHSPNLTQPPIQLDPRKGSKRKSTATCLTNHKPRRSARLNGGVEGSLPPQDDKAQTLEKSNTSSPGKRVKVFFGLNPYLGLGISGPMQSSGLPRPEAPDPAQSPSRSLSYHDTDQAEQSSGSDTHQAEQSSMTPTVSVPVNQACTPHVDPNMASDEDEVEEGQSSGATRLLDDDGGRRSYNRLPLKCFNEAFAACGHELEESAAGGTAGQRKRRRKKEKTDARATRGLAKPRAPARPEDRPELTVVGDCEFTTKPPVCTKIISTIRILTLENLPGPFRSWNMFPIKARLTILHQFLQRYQWGEGEKIMRCLDVFENIAAAAYTSHLAEDRAAYTRKYGSDKAKWKDFPPKWCKNVEAWKGLCDIWSTPKWDHQSVTNSTNVKKSKYPVHHVTGSRSMYRHAAAMVLISSLILNCCISLIYFCKHYLSSFLQIAEQREGSAGGIEGGFRPNSHDKFS